MSEDRLQGEVARRGTIDVLRNGIEAQRARDIGLYISGHGRHGGRTTRRLRLRGWSVGRMVNWRYKAQQGTMCCPCVGRWSDGRRIGQAEVATVGGRVTV